MSFNFNLAKSGKILINSHRGYSQLYPENTLHAFEGAIKEGTYSLEIDVAMTTDNQIVVIHDHSVDRTSNGSGFVEEMTLAQLQALDFGAWFAPKFRDTPIMTLQELIVWAINNKVGLVVEVKQRQRRHEFLAVLKALLDDIPHAYDYVQLLAFDHPLMVHAKTIMPKVTTQVVTIARYCNHLEAIMRSGADFVCIEYPHANEDDLKLFKKAGLGIRLYFQPNTEGLHPIEHLRLKYGGDVKGDVIRWMKEGLLDMISHDDIRMLKELAYEAGLEPV
jgi:glycerophosphoryl diester phosphodiesterase